MSIKSALLHEFHSVIKSNIMRHERMSVSLRNAVTKSRKQKITRDMARQANYVNKLTKLYNRFATEKLPVADIASSADNMKSVVPQPPHPAQNAFAEDKIIMA